MLTALCVTGSGTGDGCPGCAGDAHRRARRAVSRRPTSPRAPRRSARPRVPRRPGWTAASQRSPDAPRRLLALRRRLTLSADAGPPAGTLARVVAGIARDEGFRSRRARRLRRRNERQLVARRRGQRAPDVPRAEYDRLKAVLHDAPRDGPAAANRDGVADFRAHLQGRIAWVGQLHPARGEKLQARLDAIVWWKRRQTVARRCSWPAAASAMHAARRTARAGPATVARRRRRRRRLRAAGHDVRVDRTWRRAACRTTGMPAARSPTSCDRPGARHDVVERQVAPPELAAARRRTPGRRAR